MAITFSSGTAFTGNNISGIWSNSITLGTGQNKLFLVYYNVFDTIDFTAPTIGGVSMSAIDVVHVKGNHRVRAYYTISPPTGVVNLDSQVNGVGISGAVAICLSYEGVDRVSAIDSFAF